MAISESEKVIRTLYEISTQTHLEFEHQIASLLALGCERFNLDIGILSNINGDTYRVEHKVCPPGVALNSGDEFELGNTFCSITMAADTPVSYEHVAKSEINNHPAYKLFALESYIGVPIKIAGDIFGTLNFSSPYPMQRKFTKLDVDALLLMAAWISAELLRIDNEKQLRDANKKLAELATKDSLTNLYNRRFFQENLEYLIGLSKREGKELSIIIIIDVDNFKQHNDANGHLEGDHILIELANILQKKCRASDYVVRFGGEEFAILLPATNKEGAMHVAEDLRAEIEKANISQHNVTASFGVSSMQSLTDTNEDITKLGTQILREADKALYQSKRAGRNQVSYYNDM